jgi:hypothetical protein
VKKDLSAQIVIETIQRINGLKTSQTVEMAFNKLSKYNASFNDNRENGLGIYTGDSHGRGIEIRFGANFKSHIKAACGNTLN